MVEVILPPILDMPGLLTKILSINEADEMVTLEGWSNVGLNAKEVIVSKKENVSLWDSILSKSAFQSPEMKLGLFCFDMLINILVKKLSVNALSSTERCL